MEIRNPGVTRHPGLLGSIPLHACILALLLIVLPTFKCIAIWTTNYMTILVVTVNTVYFWEVISNRPLVVSLESKNQTPISWQVG